VRPLRLGEEKKKKESTGQKYNRAIITDDSLECEKVDVVKTSGQSNVTSGRIAAAHDGSVVLAMLCQYAPIYRKPKNGYRGNVLQNVKIGCLNSVRT